MDSVFEELAKGLFRGLVYFVAEVFFGKICFYLGWPICKLLSFGKYPAANYAVPFESGSRQRYWCSFAGLVVFVVGITSALWFNT
jgi:hypothetical protein